MLLNGDLDALSSLFNPWFSFWIACLLLFLNNNFRVFLLIFLEKSWLYMCEPKGILLQMIEDEFLVLVFDLDALVECSAHLFELCLCAFELASQCCILSHDFPVIILYAFITTVCGFCIRFVLYLVNHIRLDRVQFVRRRTVAWPSRLHILRVTDRRTFFFTAKDVQTCWFPRQINFNFFGIEIFSLMFFFRRSLENKFVSITNIVRIILICHLDCRLSLVNSEDHWVVFANDSHGRI